MKLLNRQTGETIVEVLISVAVLGLILASTYALANQSGQANRQAQERAEALNENSGHLELFKTYLEDEGDLPTSTGLFCVYQNSSGELSVKGGINGIPENAQADPLTGYPGECKSGPDGRYNTAIRKITDGSGTTYDVITRWDRVSGGGVDELSLLYKIESASILSSTFGFDPDSGISIIPRPECRDGEDNDGDGKTDYPSDLGCTSRDDNDETNLPSTIHVVVKKIPPASGNNTPSCNSAATQNRSGTTVRLGSQTKSTGSNSIAAFTGLTLLTEYNATVISPPSGFIACPPTSKNVSTGNGGTTQQVEFKIAPSCYSRITGYNSYWALGNRRVDLDGYYIHDYRAGWNSRFMAPHYTGAAPGMFWYYYGGPYPHAANAAWYWLYEAYYRSDPIYGMYCPS
jgi:type II secretory pathway pseudopilin PulG